MGNCCFSFNGGLFDFSDGASTSYSVYTALLTQSGGDDPVTWLNANNGSLVIGVTYEIANYANGDDFTNVGAPSNANGVKFVATGATAATWSGATELNFNNGAPIVKVLENTIGNIWIERGGIGSYRVTSNSLFAINKTAILIGTRDTSACANSGINYAFYANINNVDITTVNTYDTVMDDNLYNTLIEIRIYN